MVILLGFSLLFFGVFGADQINLQEDGYLLIYCLLYGMFTVLLSLFLSKYTAKKIYNIKLIDRNVKDKTELYKVLVDLIKQFGLERIPEFGVYDEHLSIKGDGGLLAKGKKYHVREAMNGVANNRTFYLTKLKVGGSEVAYKKFGIVVGASETILGKIFSDEQQDSFIAHTLEKSFSSLIPWLRTYYKEEELSLDIIKAD